MTGYVRCLAALIVSASVISNAFGLDSHSYRSPLDLATLPPDVDRDGAPDTWGTRHGLEPGKASELRKGVRLTYSQHPAHLAVEQMMHDIAKVDSTMSGRADSV